MNNEAAHSTYWRTSDVVFGGPLLLALALQWLVPLALPQGDFRPLSLIVGVALILVGLALIVLARRELRRHNQPADPGRPTSALVTSGVFAISRNPLYLGVACLLVGVALAFHVLWVLIMLVPSLILCQYVLIAPEERYLLAHFGEDYRAYMSRVGRWLG